MVFNPEMDHIPDAEQDNYLLQCAAIAAKNMAARCAILYLTNKLQPSLLARFAVIFRLDKLFKLKLPRNIEQSLIDALLRSEAAHQIITQRFYFHLYKHRKLPIHDLGLFSDEQANALTNTCMQSLMKQHNIPAAVASLCTPKQVRVIENPVYFNLLKLGDITINDITHLNDEQCFLLIYPTITTLIKRENLTFREASTLPAHLKSLLNHHTYIDLLLSQKLSSATLRSVTAEETTLLSNPAIAQLAMRQILVIETHRHLLSDLATRLNQNPGLLSSLLNSEITLDRLFEQHCRVTDSRHHKKTQSKQNRVSQSHCALFTQPSTGVTDENVVAHLAGLAI